MDRKIQLGAGIVIVVLWIIPLFSHSQNQNCDSIKVSSDSCGVELPFELFTELYKTKKNFDLITAEIPKTKKLIDSVRKANLELEESFEEQIETLNSKSNYLQKTVEEYQKDLIENQLENHYLSSKILRLKKNRKKTFILGLCVGAVSLLILN